MADAPVQAVGDPPAAAAAAAVEPADSTIPAETPGGNDENTATAAAEEAELLAKTQALDMEDSAPDLHSGELIIRQAGEDTPGKYSVEKVTSFSDLAIDDSIKKAILGTKGWQSMSKIQQIGLPLILSNPPTHLVAQAQAGTGKTGTFVIGLLARITNNVAPSRPQGIILAGTQELVTQIANEVNTLGEFKGISARRVMSAGRRGGPNDGAGNGASWELKRGEDFKEQVVVGTPGMVKNLLKSGLRKRKPMIDPSDVKVLILDEADTMVTPTGFGNDTSEVRQMILRARKTEPCQILLFSATYTDSIRPLVQEYVGNDKNSYSEITLEKKDITLDKVVNFFVTIGEPQDDLQLLEDKKRRAIIDIWESLADCNLGQTVIFVNTKQSAQQLADFLRAEGHNVGQIHGNMAKDERETVFREFREGKRPALVATNILSRGIDNPNVTLVINVDLPTKLNISGSGPNEADPETFVHRIGRSGRWTKRGASVSLVSLNPRAPDVEIMKEIERVLFANEAVNRPLIHVADPTKVGDALKQEESLQATLGVTPK